MSEYSDLQKAHWDQNSSYLRDCGDGEDGDGPSNTRENDKENGDKHDKPLQNHDKPQLQMGQVGLYNLLKKLG